MAKRKVRSPDEKLKTSIAIEKQLWAEWIHFVVSKRGSARKLSEELEQAIRYYMAKN